jgi:hypothetical protein
MSDLRNIKDRIDELAENSSDLCKLALKHYLEEK